MKNLVPAIIIASMLASAVASGQTVDFLGDLDTDITTLPVEPEGSCYFGNLRTLGAIVSGISGHLSYHAELDSVACGCGEGWRTTEVHMLVANTTDGSLETTFTVSVDGQGWGWIPSGCPEPHTGLYGELTDWISPITLPEPGYYDLVFTGTHDCAYFGYEYFLKCDASDGSDVALVIDTDGARECEVLQGVSIGERWWWVDLYSGPGSPESGGPIWWVESTCCANPVATETRSWSGVKSLYR